MAPVWEARDRSLRENLRAQIDPEGRLPEGVLEPMIDAGVKEHFSRLAYLSSRARSRRANGAKKGAKSPRRSNAPGNPEGATNTTTTVPDRSATDRASNAPT